MTNAIGKVALDFLTKRGIGEGTIGRFGIYTGSWKNDEVVPDARGNVIAFPYIERDVVVAEKYRGAGKKLWQREGGKRTFYNADVLDDLSLQSGDYDLIITEGEIDTLTAVDCGFPFAVSVPDGAPAVRPGEDPKALSPIDVEAESSGKFAFLWNNREKLKAVKKFIIAVDNDLPGQRLQAEIVRRLSAARCKLVTFPEGCKDLNDVLRNYGPAMVAGVLNGARPMPVRGLYSLDDYPEREQLEVFSSKQWWTLKPHLKLFPGEFMVVTGIPSHGKSTWVLNLLSHMADDHGWKSALFSPEMPTVPHLRDKLRRIKGSKTLDADAWIKRHFVFIDADPTGAGDDDDFSIEWILEKATDAVHRDGIRVLLIDPWNEVEHARVGGESGTDYIGRSIRSLKRFARLRDVAVIVIAHPTKDIAKDGKQRTPSLYDIEGSAHWFNKCDHGVVISRVVDEENVAEIHVAKSRFEEAGVRGTVKMKFDSQTCRFNTLDGNQKNLLEDF